MHNNNCKEEDAKPDDEEYSFYEAFMERMAGLPEEQLAEVRRRAAPPPPPPKPEPSDSELARKRTARIRAATLKLSKVENKVQNNRGQIEKAKEALAKLEKHGEELAESLEAAEQEFNEANQDRAKHSDQARDTEADEEAMEDDDDEEDLPDETLPVTTQVANLEARLRKQAAAGERAAAIAARAKGTKQKLDKAKRAAAEQADKNLADAANTAKAANEAAASTGGASATAAAAAGGTVRSTSPPPGGPPAKVHKAGEKGQGPMEP